jgi:hypothetical protein
MPFLTRGERPPWLDMMVAGLLVAASLAPFVYDYWFFHDLMVRGRAMVGRDFVNSFASAHLALQGKAAQAYSAEYLPLIRELLGRPIGMHNFSYPPTLMLFLWPLAFLGYVPALVAWTVATAAAFLLAAKAYLERAGLPLWLALAMPASLVNIWAGHHGFVLGALWLLAFAALPARPLLAGLLIALLTMKPHMGVLIPLVLLARCEWRTIAAAGAATLALIALSITFFGWQAWANYFDWTAKLQASYLVRDKAFFLYLMPTPWVSFWMATKTAWLAIAGHLCIAAAAVAIVVRAARSAMPWPELGLLTATATFLVLPYAFNYDMVLVGLAAAILLFGRGRALPWYGRILAMLAFAAPLLVFLANYFLVPLLPLVLLGFLFVQLRAYLPAAAPQPAAAPRKGTAIAAA